MSTSEPTASAPIPTPTPTPGSIPKPITEAWVVNADGLGPILIGQDYADETAALIAERPDLTSEDVCHGWLTQVAAPRDSSTSIGAGSTMDEVRAAYADATSVVFMYGETLAVHGSVGTLDFIAWQDPNIVNRMELNMVEEPFQEYCR